jgi:hypothetical protein
MRGFVRRPNNLTGLGETWRKIHWKQKSPAFAGLKVVARTGIEPDF